MNARARQPVHTAQHAPSHYVVTLSRCIECPSLAGEKQADVYVVGDGFSGVNTALELAQCGFSVALLEVHRISRGASGRNGGQLIRGVGHDVEQFLPVISADGVKALKPIGLEAVGIVCRRVEQYVIDYDLRRDYCDPVNKLGDYQGFREDMEELRALDYRHGMCLVSTAEVRGVIGSNRYVGSLVDMGSGHLHPPSLVLGEAAVTQSPGVRLFERSLVARIDYGMKIQVHTATGKMRVKTLVLGCNAHTNDLNPLLGGKVLPAGSHVTVAEPLDEQLARQLLPQNTAVCDQRVVLDYYRLSADNRLLFGGTCHYSGRDPSDIAAYMRPRMLEVFPQLANVRIGYQWGSMTGIGADRPPQIGRLPGQLNMYLVQACSGHGVNAAHLAGQLLAEATGGQQSDGSDLFAKVPCITLPGGKLLRLPLLALGMAWYRLKEKLGS